MRGLWSSSLHTEIGRESKALTPPFPVSVANALGQKPKGLMDGGLRVRLEAVANVNPLLTSSFHKGEEKDWYATSLILEIR